MNQTPKKQDKAQRGEAGCTNPRPVSEAGGQDSEKDDLAYCTTDFWQDILPPAPNLSDSVPTYMDNN